MKWRDQGPFLLCEWAVLKKIEPVYSLYYPQFEKYVDDTFTSSNTTDVRTGEVYRYGTFSLPEPFTSEDRSITGIRVNEVPSLIVIRVELAEQDRNRFDWMDVRAYISKVVFKLNERPDLTSNVPDVVGYRWFLENTKTLMSFEEWKANCLWVISPQQLAVDSSTFTESLSRVNTLGVKVTIERPKAYKNAKMQYREADFWPSKDAGTQYPAARSYTSPKFQLKVNFMFDNHSLVLNSKREVLLRKNTLKASGITGLVRDDRGLPHMKGLLPGASASSSGAKSRSGRTYQTAAAIPPVPAQNGNAAIPGVPAQYAQPGQSRRY